MSKFTENLIFLKDKFKPANLLITVGIMTVMTILSLLFRAFEFTEPNIIMLYILGVLLVSRQTDGYFYGILASILGVLTFNFFFTEPLYSLMVHSMEYPVTFSIMLIVALITSTLTTKVKREAELSKIREKRTESLYQISRNLLTTQNIDQIITTAAVNIANQFSHSVIIYATDEKGNLTEPYIYSVNDENVKSLLSENEREIAYEVFLSGKPKGLAAYYAPVTGRNKILGVIGVGCKEDELTHGQKVLLDAVTVQVALSIEREKISKKQQQSKMEMESERLRSNLLRAVSHDLKTPLTGIEGSASAILENWNNIDDDTKRQLLSSIYDDAQWLSHSVDNILNITQIEDGRIEVKKNMEAVEEIISETISRVQKYKGNHIINIKIPENLIMIPMDGSLIEQVLVNLIDNALKYTPNESIINVEAYIKDEKAVFEVSDNGKGISEKDMPFVFDRFYTAGISANNTRKGIGLGLAICKSIILAHNGEISAFNGKNGGAVFKFTLPLGE